MALTDTQLKNLKPEARTYRKSDGEGLYIEVTPGGSKLWKMAYSFDGPQKRPCCAKPVLNGFVRTFIDGID